MLSKLWEKRLVRKNWKQHYSEKNPTENQKIRKKLPRKTASFFFTKWMQYIVVVVVVEVLKLYLIKSLTNDKKTIQNLTLSLLQFSSKMPNSENIKSANQLLQTLAAHYFSRQAQYWIWWSAPLQQTIKIILCVCVCARLFVLCHRNCFVFAKVRNKVEGQNVSQTLMTTLNTDGVRQKCSHFSTKGISLSLL